MSDVPSKRCKLETSVDRQPEIVLLFKKLSENGRAPERKSRDAAGYDLQSAEDTILLPRSSVLVRTDIAIQCPEGTYGRLASRSGLAILGLDVAAGVIDRDYRGNIKILLRNSGNEIIKILKFQRVAQLILERIITPEVKEVTSLSRETEGRGSDGFGSTGK